METRAPYTLIGLFVLVVVAAVFGFVYWLHNVGGLSERTAYRVQFENSVSGMLIGAAVLFNGIRVGEVTNLELDPTHPNHIIATVAVASGTPVRADTKAGIDFQGISGVAVVTLSGGNPGAPKLVSTDGKPPIIVADPLAWQTMTQAARTVLQRLDSILAQNSDAFKTAMSNISAFAEALGRNSNKVDGILLGLERMTGGGAAAAPPALYDLSAPRDFPPLAKTADVQLSVNEPTTVLLFDTQKILVRPQAPESSTFESSRWADSLPKLIQARIVQGLENSKYLAAVTRLTEGVESDYQLLTDIRKFEIETSPETAAVVELSVKILGKDGRIKDSRVFRVALPTKVTDAEAAAKALNEAFGQVARQVVTWTATELGG
jgi:phospholipid/cholesterol/gamma-HCH transport system substrate-binding protein